MFTAKDAQKCLIKFYETKSKPEDIDRIEGSIIEQAERGYRALILHNESEEVLRYLQSIGYVVTELPDDYVEITW